MRAALRLLVATQIGLHYLRERAAGVEGLRASLARTADELAVKVLGTAT